MYLVISLVTKSTKGLILTFTPLKTLISLKMFLTVEVAQS